MVTVDSKGRIVLPQDLREQFGLGSGTEVSVRKEGGQIVVEPEDDPEEIIDDIETLIEKASRDRPAPDTDDPFARDHLEAIQRGANRTEEDQDE